jgi:hypothetical protein
MKCNNYIDNSILTERNFDPSWAVSYDYKITMGYIILVNGSPVQWASNIDKKKINKSSWEVEYIALSKTISNTLALKNILLESLPNHGLKVKFYPDNEALKDIVKVMHPTRGQDTLI